MDEGNLRKQLEGELGPIPDPAWTQLLRAFGSLESFVGEEDFLGPARDWVMFAQEYARSIHPGAGQGRPRKGGRPAKGVVYQKCYKRRRAIVRLVAEYKAEEGIGGMSEADWRTLSAALTHSERPITPQALRRTYYRGQVEFKAALSVCVGLLSVTLMYPLPRPAESPEAPGGGLPKAVERFILTPEARPFIVTLLVKERVDDLLQQEGALPTGGVLLKLYRACLCVVMLSPDFQARCEEVCAQLDTSGQADLGPLCLHVLKAVAEEARRVLDERGWLKTDEGDCLVEDEGDCLRSK